MPIQIRWPVVLLGILLVLAVTLASLAAVSSASAQPEGRDVRPPEITGGVVPGEARSGESSFEMWRQVRMGVEGTTTFADPKLGILIQSEGDNWRAIRNGPVAVYGSWIMLGMIVLLALFYLLRGRVMIEAGESGRTIERFNSLDRFAHWLTAVSFIILAVTGLNILYGRYIFMPILGPTVFAWFTQIGKYAHNFVAFAFMLGIVLMFVLWVRHNIPGRLDFKWIARGGGLFGGGHPPAEQFNAGQKVIFWAVILGGVSVSLSGLALLFPYTFGFFNGTFGLLAAIGLNVPTDIGVIQEQQLNHLWHVIVSLILIAIILAHIYIGSIGMQGAFAAMGSGRVDENWAREHHSLWYERVTGKPAHASAHRDDEEPGHEGGSKDAKAAERAQQPAE